MKKIFFGMFYSILVGEEPDSVLLKKEGKQNQVKITPSSCAKDLTISEGTGATSLFNFHSRVPTRKRIMVTPPLITSLFSFINLIVIEIHVLPRHNL